MAVETIINSLSFRRIISGLDVLKLVDENKSITLLLAGSFRISTSSFCSAGDKSVTMPLFEEYSSLAIGENFATLDRKTWIFSSTL